MKERQPPCATCYPGMHPWNETAFTVYKACEGQWRFSSGGATVLDILAVESAMRLCSIPQKERWDLSLKVLEIGNVILNEVHSEAESKRSASAAQPR